MTQKGPGKSKKVDEEKSNIRVEKLDLKAAKCSIEAKKLKRR